MHCFPLLRRRMVVQNLFEAVRKSFSMASPNSSHVRVFASVTATAALRLACRYLPAASGVPQAKKFDGIPHRRCPPAGSGIAATAGTDHLAATALVGRLNNGGVEHGPLGLNVPRLPRYMVKALPEVGVEALSDRRLCQTFPADPHDTFGSASSAPLFARVSKTCGRKSDDTTTKSIIELRPRVSWCQAQTTVRIRPPTRRRREATLSSTGVNSNILAPSRGAISIATPARRLSPVATPEWKRVQPLSRRLVPEPLLCVEVRPTISSRNFSTSRTSSGSFPTREVTFHVPRASFCSRGSDRQGPRLRPPPSSHCTRPLWPLLLVVSRREGGPTSSFRAVPGRAPNNYASIHCPEVTKIIGLIVLPGLNDDRDGATALMAKVTARTDALQAKQGLVRGVEGWVLNFVCVPMLTILGFRFTCTAVAEAAWILVPLGLVAGQAERCMCTDGTVAGISFASLSVFNPSDTILASPWL
ncbi:hypothetical protein N1851_000378 [Merluccius polli]|uniref:Uncharacterized protein n=1 Tax=Merluccius polli TaxID=89951 RepID=A0AA47NDP6_MERPO|nr:hypothetical protein N1851_000378 [Merluccius polli]